MAAYMAPDSERSVAVLRPGCKSGCVVRKRGFSRTKRNDAIGYNADEWQLAIKSTRRWMACLRNSWRMTASLPLNHRPPTTSIVQRRHVWGSTNSHKSWWSIIHCCWTTSVEQPTSPSTWFWTYSPWVPPVTEDASVFLRIAARSDGCFRARYESKFTFHYITTNKHSKANVLFTDIFMTCTKNKQNYSGRAWSKSHAEFLKRIKLGGSML